MMSRTRPTQNDFSCRVTLRTEFFHANFFTTVPTTLPSWRVPTDHPALTASTKYYRHEYQPIRAQAPTSTDINTNQYRPHCPNYRAVGAAYPLKVQQVCCFSDFYKASSRLSRIFRVLLQLKYCSFLQSFVSSSCGLRKL